MSLFDKFEKNAEVYNALKAAGTNPLTVEMQEILSTTRARINGRETVLAGTHNYLGMNFSEDAIAAAKKALDTEGTGTTGSRVANGTYSGHKALEQAIADFLGLAECMVFSTGYQANLGAIAALAKPGEDVILIDADCHACIYDGCQLSGAETIRFRHNSPENLDKRLSRLGPDVKGKLVCIEGTYSMLGDSAPVKEFADVTHAHGGYLYVDEAHSFGVYGDTGKGVSEAENAMDIIDFYSGTFSKSLASIGGFVASNHKELEYLRFSSRAYMFTASPSPSSIASAHAALNTISPAIRDKLWANINRFHGAFRQFGLNVAADPSPVISILLPSREATFMAWNFLLEQGVYVNMAIPPGTPDANTFLLRLSVSAAHTDDDAEKIINAYKALADTFEGARVPVDA
ncbi:MAG: aminotransferase class I/II-fold pyridoxal phosphate-dependent enzyme [Pseudomonadota bacterium]